MELKVVSHPLHLDLNAFLLVSTSVVQKKCSRGRVGKRDVCRAGRGESKLKIRFIYGET